MPAILFLTIAVLFFAGMGLLALARPAAIAALVGEPAPGRDGRNEIRAVYGGFGVALAGLLAALPWLPAWRAGALVAVAVALLGMAAGRVVSWALDGAPGRNPWVFFVTECGLAALLLGAR